MSLSKEDMIANIKKKLNNKIYFYSSKSNAYGFLSNFYPSPIKIDGREYYHVEGFYQASKFTGYNDDVSEVIRDEINPLTCKNIANNVDLTDNRKQEWDSTIKLQIMKQAVLTKFISNTELKSKLLATEDKELIEDSPTDYYWGCGRDGSGKNMLGIVLMNVREILRSVFTTN